MSDGLGRLGRLGRQLLCLGGDRGQLLGALGDQFLEVMAIGLQFTFGALAFGNVEADLHDQPRAVRVAEGEVVDVVIAAVRAGPFPAVRLAGLEHLVRFAVFAGLAAVEEVFVAAAALRLAKSFFEEAVGKGDVVIGREQDDVSREHVQQGVEPLALDFHRLGGCAALLIFAQRFLCCRWRTSLGTPFAREASTAMPRTTGP